jgi:hypothetical protein
MPAHFIVKLAVASVGLVPAGVPRVDGLLPLSHTPLVAPAALRFDRGPAQNISGLSLIPTTGFSPRSQHTALAANRTALSMGGGAVVSPVTVGSQATFSGGVNLVLSQAHSRVTPDMSRPSVAFMRQIDLKPKPEWSLSTGQWMKLIASFMLGGAFIGMLGSGFAHWRSYCWYGLGSKLPVLITGGSMGAFGGFAAAIVTGGIKSYWQLIKALFSF